MDLINQLANERHNLYRLAGKQHFTPQQEQRLGELNNQLPILWDQHRRELASDHYPRPAVFSPAFNWSDDEPARKSSRSRKAA
ncbi:MAG TPA: hypothetical protein VHL11_16525 [Phototrophicaceae bacterium]|nr:hypothetical protein [Phototrophicaceae bacterium]